MNGLLLDTHALAWTLSGEPRLSQAALHAISRGEAIFVSPISLYEMAQKARVGKWDEVKPLLAEMPYSLTRRGVRVAPLTPDICIAAGGIEWKHRGPFDRLIACTSMDQRLALVSGDPEFDTIDQRSGGVHRIW